IGPGADLLHVLLEPGDVTIDVVHRDLAPDPVIVHSGDFVAEAIQLRQLGQVAPPVRELRPGGVDRLQGEQAALGGRIGLHGLDSFWVEGSRWIEDSCSVQTSVTMSETMMSSGSSARSSVASTSSQGRSVAQCAASSNAGPPPATCSLAGWWR